jgi:hypothetical protein
MEGVIQMLKAALLKEICDALDSHRNFYANDFAVSSTDQPRATQILVKYLYLQDFSLELVIPTSKTTVKTAYGEEADFVITAVAKPGSLNSRENCSYVGRTGMLEGIRNWLEDLAMELAALPQQRRIQNERESVDRLAKEFGGFAEEEFFSKSEAAKLQARLDELENQFKQRIEAMGLEKKELKEQLSALHLDFDMLRGTVETLQKKGWLRSFLVRASRWASDPENRELLAAGKSIVENLLPPQ